MHALALLGLLAYAPHVASGAFFPILSAHRTPCAQAQDSNHQFPLMLDVEKRGSHVPNSIIRAELAFSALLAWCNPRYGLFGSTGWWNNANIITSIANLAKYDPGNSLLQDIAVRIFITAANSAPALNPQPGVEDIGKSTGYNKTVDANGIYITTYPEGWFQKINNQTFGNKMHDTALLSPPNPEDWLDGAYDDDLWWALAWINVYDVTHDPWYLQLAEGIFAAVTKVWPTRCGNGGIYWMWNKNYVNAIANELFMSTAASLANRVENTTSKALYVSWATRSLEWFLKSGMLNEKGLVNDGLTDGCGNNGQTTWSYNQGVILGGLVELNRASPNKSYLELASKIAHAAIDALSDSNSIIHDVCEPNCGPDGTQFKGIFVRNLQKLHEVAPDDGYVEAIQMWADSIWWEDRDEWNRFSVNWAGPFTSPANASTHSSAMEALIAALSMR